MNSLTKGVAVTRRTDRHIFQTGRAIVRPRNSRNSPGFSMTLELRPPPTRGLVGNASFPCKVGVFDVDGVLRGKYMGRENLLSLDKGLAFATWCWVGIPTISFTTS